MKNEKKNKGGHTIIHRDTQIGLELDSLNSN